jgi:hypothetical protein
MCILEETRRHSMNNAVYKFVTNKSALVKIEKKDGSWFVSYENIIYTKSPFVMPTSFSKEHSIVEVLDSKEVKSFLSRFDDSLYCD